MSGEVQGPRTQLMSPAQASRVLEDVIYLRVLECIDLEKLHLLELDVWVAMSEQELETCARLDAQAMIDRALARFATDAQRYASIESFGFHCPDCDEEAAAMRSPKPKRS